MREAARQGVVKTFPTCGSATTDWDKLKCNTKDQMEILSGTAYVKVAAPDGWVRGKRLLVCAIVKTSDPIGFLPMPNDGYITSKTQLSIEKDTTVPTGIVVRRHPARPARAGRGAHEPPAGA